MKSLLMILAVVAMSVMISLPAMADRHRHGGHKPQVHHHYHHHDHRAERGKHHRRHHAKAPHRYRQHRSVSRRGIGQRDYDHGKHWHRDRPRYHDYRRDDRRRDYRGHTDIPLVTVGGYPVIRVQVNH
ncbi:hypothetical protein [Halomonas urumqiensis]|uniref:Uncharacterized protein n=1 Tax=Halomonas urumqiensis TaxID=1684789 RepID=A0A2N7ULB5_9GAMM|nr:hypothetical protein [Halomonas urumqiensis]PMR81235.1 hypothetical protein C1H70_05860 [Halomonas urumqiensis]PTB01754.1 hypothetical protein C6V82_13850 [Halomonas urumqiensis]GHE22146.1 hypothetical protein GCM10017767_26670 [Halomonas urumqiensis]